MRANVARPNHVLATVCTLALAVVASVAQAGTAYLDDASGPLTWDDATTPDWSTTSDGLYDLTWSGASGTDAHFEGTAGTVTVAYPTGIPANINSIAFDVAGYTLSGGVLGLPSAGGTITTAGDATINSTLNGGNLTKQGNAMLTLTAGNGYTGTTAISAGTLRVQGGVNRINGATATFTVANGATLDAATPTRRRSKALASTGAHCPVAAAETGTSTTPSPWPEARIHPLSVPHMPSSTARAA